MRKFTLLILFVSFAVFAFAQSKTSQRTQKFPNERISKDLKTEIQHLRKEKAIGKVIWQDDFSVPSNWVISNKSNDNQNWVITKVSSTSAGYGVGTWKETENVSDENGYAMFDSDALGGDGGSQDADITTKNGIDLTDYPSVEITFRQRVSLWQTTVTSVQVSTDDFATWKSYDINAGRPTSTKFEETVAMNISAAAGGKANVKIRFNYVGSWDYLWLVDDVKILEAPNNELVINAAWINFVNAAGDANIGYYSMFPVEQVTYIPFFYAAIFNNGSNDQTNAQLNVSIDNNDSIVHSITGYKFPLSVVGARDTIDADSSLAVENYFEPALKLAAYNVNFELKQDQIDENLSNNKYQVKFNVTDTVFARDFVRKTYTGPSRYLDGKDGDRIGVEYSFAQKQEVSSISIYIDELSDPGTSFIGKIISSDLSEILTTDIYVIDSTDLGKWVSVSFVKDGTSEFIEAGTSVYAMMECYFDGIGDIYVGADNSSNQTFEYSLLQLGGDNGYIDVMPMVRLNVKSTAPCSAFISSKENVTCYGGNNGSAIVSVGGGVSPYTYLWSTNATTESISNLTAGTYTVTVTDAKDSISVASVTIEQPDSILITGTIKDQGGFETTDGMIDVSVSGGTPAYKYIWSNGNAIQDLEEVLDGTYTITVTDANACTESKSFDIAKSACLMSSTISSTNNLCFGDKIGTASIQTTNEIAPLTFAWNNDSTTQSISNLAAGIYKVTVTDSIGCLQFPVVEITQPAKLIPSIVGTNISCHGLTDGSIDLTILGGVSPFDVLWSNNATTQDLSALVAGVYTVVVKDSNLCTATDSVTIIDPAILAASISKTDIKCKDASTGAANLTVTGGTEPFTFAWSNSATTEDITGLAVADYKVTVTDSRACTVKDSTSILDLAISPIEISITVNGPWIYGNVNTAGNIDLTVTGGSTPYTYAWSNSQTTEDITITSKGNYTVTITDAIGCVVTQTSNATGIKENPIKSAEFSIYPNPSNGVFNFTNVENANIAIFNIIGEQVMMVNAENKNMSINLNKLADGTYIVKIIKNGNVITKKITLKK